MEERPVSQRSSLNFSIYWGMVPLYHIAFLYCELAIKQRVDQKRTSRWLSLLRIRERKGPAANNNFKIIQWKCMGAKEGNKGLLMRVSKLDAFALKQYLFKVNRTNNHFTLATVLLSLLLIALAVYFNLPTVSHLWLSRQQLPTKFAQTLTNPNPLTPTYICYRPNDSLAPLPKARALSVNLSELELPFLPAEQMLRENPSFSSKMGQNFGCFDMAGLMYSQESLEYYVEVMDRATLSSSRPLLASRSSQSRARGSSS